MTESRGTPTTHEAATLNNNQGDGATDRTLSPSELTYLIGTKHLPLAEITDPVILPAAKAIKGTGDSYDLGAHTVTAALVALRDEGAISLEYVESKKLRVFTSRHVMMAKTGESAFGASTLEHHLAASIPRGAPQSATKAVGKWFGPNVKHPADRACRSAAERLKALGLVVIEDQQVERGTISKAMSGKQTKTVAVAKADKAQVTAALPQVASWSARWTILLSDESELVGHLFAEIKSLLKSKVEANNDISDYTS